MSPPDGALILLRNVDYKYFAPIGASPLVSLQQKLGIIFLRRRNAVRQQKCLGGLKMIRRKPDG